MGVNKEEGQLLRHRSDLQGSKKSWLELGKQEITNSFINCGGFARTPRMRQVGFWLLCNLSAASILHGTKSRERRDSGGGVDM